MYKRVIVLTILIINLITTVNIKLVQAAPVGLDLARMANEVLIDIDNKEELDKIRLDYRNDSYDPLSGCNLRHSSNINHLEYITQKIQQIEDANKQQINISILSENEIQQLFQELNSKSHIPFGYPEDGCYARAQEMSLILDKKGVTTGKVFIEGDLRVDTTNSPKGYVEWWYHVAPIVFVKKNNKLVSTQALQYKVIDKQGVDAKYVQVYANIVTNKSYQLSGEIEKISSIKI